ncbi:cyclic 3',5'-adenosine monophosphate phosphodiesterase [Limihaloglobus sulfuriphilus]|uniref:Cyclic 3',5'-adenosine monophosphate phosphodiesterase n=1 Tax=Limihaloglobus sulfuriphilus TaxID=1851148 RepID=A0A1Q2MGH6_9BACT|nr:metallophosphoesterase [Limihaloglobus sulfuriphilus]AQQ71754.1 cyclic 3',5'-adenosine monophosphate phosphodiesterase [Limihaloglobus sulfuriphilus]
MLKIYSLVSGLLMFFLISGCGDEPAAYSVQGEPEFSIGVVADVQYADRDDIPKYNSYYRPSLGKLTECVETFNRRDLEFAIQLGDLVDIHLESYDKVLPIWEKIRCDKYHVIGNHDLSDTADYDTLLNRLSMDSNYYDFKRGGWRFIVIDTNEISVFSQPEGSEKYELARSILDNLKEQGSPKAVPWNATVSDEQLDWVDALLSEADNAGEPVVIFGHHPYVSRQESLTALNNDKVVQVFESHPSFKAYICGHDHDGGYVYQNGRHYLTLNGLMSTPDTNAYAIMDFYPGRIVVNGFGRVDSREMNITDFADNE